MLGVPDVIEEISLVLQRKIEAVNKHEI